MNLKFFDDIIQTIEVMKSGFYYLGLLIGVHTVTFAAYLAYKYLNDNSDDSKKDKQIENTDTIDKSNDPELPPPLSQNSEPVIQMEEVSDLLDKKQVYKSLLEQKREELGNLIGQLDSVYDNIGTIRERLENLNNKTN